METLDIIYMQFTAPKVTISVADINLVGYKTEKGEWVMSQASVTDVLNVEEVHIRNFLQSKWLKQRLGKGSKTETFSVKVEGSKKPIVSINTQLAALFFRFQDSRNDNPVAQKLVDALMTQALDIRFEGNLTPEKSYKNVEEYALSIQQERKLQLEQKVQNLFQSWMVSHHFSPAKVHDYLTKRVVGRTAAESRQLPQTCPGKRAVGLNHFQASEYPEMSLISRVKLYCTTELPRQRKGWGYQDYIDIAIQEVMS